MTEIPVRVKRLGVASHTYEDIKLPILDPHLVIDYLFQETGLHISPAVVKRFWYIKRELAKERWALNSPATSDHIPLAVYGDACQCKGGKLLGIFISLPLWRARSTRSSRWLICALEEARLWGTNTLNTIMRRVTFSLNMLFDGWDLERGKQLAGGRLFTLTELRGDWLWHKQLWNFSSSWKSLTNICYRCDCKARSQNPHKLFWDIDGGVWHEYTRPEFITSQLGNSHPCSLTWNTDTLNFFIPLARSHVCQTFGFWPLIIFLGVRIPVRISIPQIPQ